MSVEPQSIPDEIVRIDRPAAGGGVGRLADGRVVFVRHSLPTERVLVHINEVTSRFARGDAIEVLDASPFRVSAPCVYARPGGCGGCDLQHASLEAQSSWKTTLIQEHLTRIAGVERTIELQRFDDEGAHSRTRLRCAVNENGQLGLRVARSHDVIALSSCWVSDDRFAQAFHTSWDGAEEVELRAIGEGAPFAVVRRETHRGTMYEICSLRGEPLEPSTHSRVGVNGQHFVVSPRSFWQSHRRAPEVLLSTVLEFAHIETGDHVVDLFSGVGLFSVAASKIVGPTGRVTAVESSPYAVRDARQNADGLTNIKVREWSVSARAINDSVAMDDVVILDPPRNGLAKGVVDALVRRDPKRIVYVSCDSATFARDLKGLLAGGFVLRELRAFDLFAMTEHVELVALLDKGA